MASPPDSTPASQASLAKFEGKDDAKPKKKRHVGFLDGLKAPFSGLWFLIRHPATWPLAMVPLLVACVLFVLLSFGGYSLMAEFLHWLMPGKDAWVTVGRVFAKVISGLIAMIFAAAAGLLLAQPLSGPALEALVRYKEKSLGLPARPKTPFLLDMWRAARSALIGSLGLPVILLLSILEVAIPGSSVVIIPLKVVFSGLFVAWDLIDYPLTVRSFPLKKRLNWVLSHKAACFGFGVALATVFLIPCAQLLLLPVGVLGATALLVRSDELDLENTEAELLTPGAPVPALPEPAPNSMAGAQAPVSAAQQTELTPYSQTPVPSYGHSPAETPPHPHAPAQTQEAAPYSYDAPGSYGRTVPAQLHVPPASGAQSPAYEPPPPAAQGEHATPGHHQGHEPPQATGESLKNRS